MERCIFCGASLTASASFCGICGRTVHQENSQATQIADQPTQRLGHDPGDNDATILTNLEKTERGGTLTSVSVGPLSSAPGQPGDPATLAASAEEDEEEKRRRAALLGFGAPLLGVLADQRPLGQIPTIQGPPQMGQMPVIAGTPQAPGGALPPGSHAPFAPGGATSPVTPFHPGPHQGLNTPLPGHPSGSPGGTPGGSPGGSPAGSTGGTPGCLTLSAIILVAIIVIVSSFIGLGLTVWAPNIALSGGSSVAPGGTLVLHGSSFLPNSSITLTLDGGVPIYFSRHVAPSQLAHGYALSEARVAQMLLVSRSFSTSNVISAHGDGTFSVTLQIDPSMHIGQHALHATEAPTHRSASLAFTVIQPAVIITVTVTPGTTPTGGVTPALTPSPGVTPSPISTPGPKPTPNPTAKPPTPTPTQVPTPTPTPPPPLISVNPTSIYFNSPPSNCVFNTDGSFSCPATLFNSSRVQRLGWSWSVIAASGGPVSSITVSAPNGTVIGAGGSEGVTILFGTQTPCATAYIIFTGPGPNNKATITYSCTIIG